MNMRVRNRVLNALLMAAVFYCLAPSASAHEDISLQLKWKHAFQFAGFYMALEKGYYDQRELNVTLNEGGPGKNPIDHILADNDRYGVTDTGAVLARAKGKPVKVLAAIFQHSPLALAVTDKSGIRSFSDLKGKRAMMQTGGMDAVILAAMKKAGVSENDFTRQDTSFNLQDLINGNTDAFSVYLTDQPHQLKEKGIAYHLLNPSDYDIDFYGDILITSDDEIHKHPGRVQAFIEASLQGWDYALDHIDETVALILAKYNTQHLSSGQLYFEAYKTSEMVLKDVVKLGYMNQVRWQKIVQTYAALGLISADFPVSTLIYEPEPTFIDILGKYRWQLLAFGLTTLLLVFALQSLLLRRMVRTRTKELASSETRFRTLVDNIPGAVFRYKPDSRYSMEFISEDIERISGFPAADFIGNARRSYRSIIHPDDMQMVHESILTAIGQGDSYDIEYRIRCADASERWLMETGQAGGNANKEPWVDGCILDITDRKRAENLKSSSISILEMVAAEKNLTLILEKIVASHESRYPGMKASILLVRDGRLYQGAAPSLPAEYNDAIEGLEIGPMVGSCGTAAFNKERVIVEDIEHDPRWANYADFVLPMGLRACWSEPIIGSAGTVLGTFAMYHDHPRSPGLEELEDISHAAKLTAVAIERDQSFEKLKKLSRAIEQSSEVVTIVDKEGKIEYVNPAYTTITGYSRDEAIGKTPRLLRDEMQQQTADQMRAELRKGKSWQGKTLEKKKDGSFYPAMVTVSPIRNENGETSHYISVHEDLSKIQLLEEQFYQSQKMEAIGTLVGGIAHDFNNMLAGITGNLYLAKMQTNEQPKLVEKLDIIESLSLRAADMIKQLLTFANKGLVRKQTVPLAPLIREALKLHRVSISENINISADIHDDLIVSADITQMQQILLNLLTNARDAVSEVAHPEIHIVLNQYMADEAFVTLHPEAENSHRYAHLSVQDNGHGIAKHQLAQIFEPFFTTKETGKGTGLGLSMVFGSVKSHDGFIDVDSIRGKGSTFHIYLPQLDVAVQAQETETPGVEAGKGETILLVDDESELLDTTAKVLISLDYQVHTASNGKKAMCMFADAADTVDLILSDIVMPEMGGYELAEKVRLIKPGLPIVFATGYDKKEALGEKPLIPNSLVLSKPFAVENLSQALRKMLKQR